MDDILIIADSTKEIDIIASEVKQQVSNIKYDNNDNISFLGLSIIRSSKGDVSISSESYIKNVISWWGDAGSHKLFAFFT